MKQTIFKIRDIHWFSSSGMHSAGRAFYERARARLITSLAWNLAVHAASSGMI